MPTYNYECPREGCDEKQLEVFHKLAEDGPKCSKHTRTPMVKMLSAPSFHLKGGCWEKDGYASTQKGGSVDAKEVGEGLMNAAREGAKKGGSKAGVAAVKSYQDRLAKSAGTKR